MAKFNSEEIQEVYEAWRDIQPRPALCRLTKTRIKMIAIIGEEGYTADDICVLMEYAGNSSDSMPKWWRGENPERKKYIGLDNLLRRTKLADRVEAALNWKIDKDNPIEIDNIFPFRIVKRNSNE